MCVTSTRNNMEKVSEPPVIQVKLIPAQTAEERHQNIIANVVVEGNSEVPYIDDAITAITVTPLEVKEAKDQKPRLRYYAVGPSTYRILCPLCQQHGDAAVMRTPGLKDATCCLSWLSFVFPIFWICAVFTWCGCNRNWTTNGLYCSRCGGKLGLQR